MRLFPETMLGKSSPEVMGRRSPAPPEPPPPPDTAPVEIPRSPPSRRPCCCSSQSPLRNLCWVWKRMDKLGEKTECSVSESESYSVFVCLSCFVANTWTKCPSAVLIKECRIFCEIPKMSPIERLFIYILIQKFSNLH